MENHAFKGGGSMKKNMESIIGLAMCAREKVILIIF
jgi:hypothetical protein